MAPARQCQGDNAAGDPCGAPPLKRGTVIEGVTVSGNWCRQHDQDLPESARIGGAQPGAGRPRNPRPTEVGRRLIEANVLPVQRPYWRILGYDVKLGPDGPYLVELPEGGAKVSATYEGKVIVSEVEDLAAQMQASEKLQDRHYGRPKQQTEISGPEGGPVEVIDTRDPETRAALHALLERRPASSGS